MKRPWTAAAFDSTSASTRVLVLAGVLMGGLLVVYRPSGALDAAVAAAALVSCLAGARWPFAALLSQSCLLVAAHQLGAGIVPAVKVLAAVTLFELAVRRSGRRVAAGAAVLALAVAANRLADLPGALPEVLYKMGIVAGLPLLLGAYIRFSRDAVRHVRERAEQDELRAGQRLLAARAAERTAIARELHDLVAHHVSSMVLRVGVARHVLGDTGTDRAADPRITDVLDDLHSSGSAALEDLRRLVAVLRDPDSARPATASLVAAEELPAVLDEVVSRSRRNGLAVTASLDPAVAGLDAVRGLAVLRLVQEGLANVVKHAGPGAHARLTVRMAGGGAIHVGLHDDGARTHRPPEPGPRGHGLIGMRERVSLLGGSLEAGPASTGWRLIAELPASTASLEPQT
ncbi:two-component sensor histidine kinase [Streptomyces agglomeratus]|uniref:histidine kinase n=1 Tax=Streptomyces agglomeratus TaxID=285458 RepID=A0A1E5PJZ1_9ACTN|nr:histidine kinase [Streptomyces agglomeratus]OEJ29878.1 two-component sensor histidine kinase [Streptomyces agglomeratus]